MQDRLSDTLGSPESDDEAFEQVRERVQALISAARTLSDTCADLADALRPAVHDDPLVSGFGRLRAERTAALLDEAASAARGTLGLLHSAYGALDRGPRFGVPVPRSGASTWPDAFVEVPPRAFTVDDEAGTALERRPVGRAEPTPADATDPHGIPAAVADATDPHGIPAAVADATDPHGIPAAVADATDAHPIPAAAADSLDAHPAAAADATDAHPIPAAVADATDAHPIPAPAADSTDAHRIPTPAADSTDAHPIPTPAADSTDAHRIPTPAADSTDAHRIPTPAADSTDAHRIPTPAADSTDAHRIPTPAADSTDADGIPAAVADSTDAHLVPAAVADATDGIPAAVVDAAERAGPDGESGLSTALAEDAAEEDLGSGDFEGLRGWAGRPGTPAGPETGAAPVDVAQPQDSEAAGTDPAATPAAPAAGPAEPRTAATLGAVTLGAAEPEIAPELRAAPTAEPTVNPMPGTAPETAPDTVLETAPGSQPEAAPETVSETAPEPALETGPEAVLQETPKTGADPAPDAVAEPTAEPTASDPATDELATPVDQLPAVAAEPVPADLDPTPEHAAPEPATAAEPTPEPTIAENAEDAVDADPETLDGEGLRSWAVVRPRPVPTEPPIEPAPAGIGAHTRRDDAADADAADAEETDEHSPDDVDGEGLRSWAGPAQSAAALAGWMVVDPDDADDPGHPIRERTVAAAQGRPVERLTVGLDDPDGPGWHGDTVSAEPRSLSLVPPVPEEHFLDGPAGPEPAHDLPAQDLPAHDDPAHDDPAHDEPFRDALPRSQFATNTLPGNELSQNALSQNALPEDELSQNALSQNALSGNALSGNALSRDELSRDELSGDELSPAGAVRDGLTAPEDPWATEPAGWSAPDDLSGAAAFARPGRPQQAGRVDRPVWAAEPAPGASVSGDGVPVFPIAAPEAPIRPPVPEVLLEEPAAAVIARQVEAARRHLQAALVVANDPSAPGLGSLLTAVEQVLTAVTDLARETRGLLESGLADRTFPGEARFLCSPPWDGVALVGRDAYGDDAASPAGLAKLLRALGYEAHSATSAGGVSGVQIRADRYAMQVALVEPAGGGRQRWSGALEWVDSAGANRTWAETLGPVELEDEELARRVDELLRRSIGSV